MTQIDFFSNAPIRIEYVARLLQKVQQRGQNAVVYGEAPTLQLLSTSLWQSSGFLAHELILEPIDNLPNVAPSILTAQPHAHFPHHEVLINLSDEQPAFFAQFERLIEVVPNEDTSKQRARERCQNYKHTRYAMTHHDIKKKKK